MNLPPNLSPEEHAKQLPLAIFQTNAVAAGQGVGLFPRMARLNHACSHAFNSIYSWRDDEGILVVYALKDIKQGEVSGTPLVIQNRCRECCAGAS